nr:ParA family protein [Campylobacter sp.]
MSKIITFAHPKGGVGKTMLAFNYCVNLLLGKQKRFCIIDLDGQHSITNFNKIRNAYELSGLDIKHFDNDKDLANFIQNNDYEIVVIDTGGFDSSLNRIVLALSDIIITPVSDSPVETLRLFDFNNILSDIAKEMGLNELKTHIVLNRIHSSVKNIDTLKAPYSRCRNFTFFDSVIRDRARYKFSIAGGKSVFEENKYEYDKKAVKELRSLFKEIENLK